MTYAKFTLLLVIWFAAGFVWGKNSEYHDAQKHRVIEHVIEHRAVSPTWRTPASSLQPVNLAKIKVPKNIVQLFKKLRIPPRHKSGDEL